MATPRPTNGTVLGALAALGEEERRCLILKVVAGCSYDEIGRLTGLTPAVVGERVHRGLHLLAAALGTGCIGPVGAAKVAAEKGPVAPCPARERSASPPST